MILLIIATLIIAYVINFYWNLRKYPKGPLPFPLVGNLFQLTPNGFHHDVERLGRQYGKIFTIWLMNRPVVVLFKDDVMREALLTNAGTFEDRTNDFPETMFQSVENGGVIFSSGENWREQRRNALHILRDFGVGKNIMEQFIIEEIEHFAEHIEASDMKRIELRWPIQVMVANVINKLLYNFSYGFEDCEPLMDYANKLNSIFTEMWDSPLMVVATVFPSIQQLPWIGEKTVGRHLAKYKSCIDFVNKDIERALKDFNFEEDPTCFVQAYVQRMDKNEFLNKKQLSNVCSDFFMAGMETTSTTLRWAVLYLAKYQAAQAKLRDEVASVVGFDRTPSLSDRNKMPYTAAFINELQRCSNIVSVNLLKKASQDTVISGCPIAKGTRMLFTVYSALKDEANFPEPDTFKPERFLTEDGKIDQALNNKMVAFSIGKRQCAGESLARAELFLGVTCFVQKFKFFSADGWTLDLTPSMGGIQLPPTNYLRLEKIR